MLVIGKRGGGDHLPENTLQAIAAGIQAGVDIVHLDIRLTKDAVPILLHDATLQRTHHQPIAISSITFSELKKLLGKNTPPTLDGVLKRWFGKIMLNIELHSRQGSNKVAAAIQFYAGNHQSKWDNVLFSSYKVSELIALKKAAPYANIALLQDNNPFAFTAYHRFLQFSAVGFHRLHTNHLALQIAKKAEIFTFAYTVDRPNTAKRLAEQGLDGVVSSNPKAIIGGIS